jgi:ABC-type uncharacterized transport system substrate-binding protein
MAADGARAAGARTNAACGVLMGYGERDSESQRWIRAFLDGLHQQAWVVGSTIAIEYRWTTGGVERMRPYAAELVALNPDVIFAASSPALASMRQESSSIPIVFVNVADPVGQGFVASLAHPGGNITGFTSGEYSMAGKWIELLKVIQPSLTRTAVLVHLDTAPYFPLYWQVIERAASKLVVNPVSIPVRDAADIERTISGIEDLSSTGLVVTPSAFMSVHRDRIIAVAAQHRLPAIYGWNYYARSGGLLSYGIDAPDLFRRSALYIDQILKGSKPADLPVQQPTKFELVINLKTAKALGLDVPLQLQQIADEVIE